MLARGRDDIEAVLSRDAAAQSPLEVALLYPGVHAVWAHRLSHALWERGARRSARAVSQVARFATGIEIHPGATLGPRLFIDHGMGVVIGETTRIGAGAKILGNLVVGPDSRIGANVVLLHSVEAHSVISGTCPREDLAPGHHTPTSPRTP